jgi:hypothetical protein
MAGAPIFQAVQHPELDTLAKTVADGINGPTAFCRHFIVLLPLPD